MKKVVGLVLVLMLLATVALAESVPSKSTADMVVTTVVQAENIPVDSGFTIAPVVDEEKYVEQIAVCQAEVTKLAESATVEEYFGEVKNAEGEVVSIKEILDSETLNVHEFMPVVVENYDATYGKVVVTFQFATPYEKDEIVIVLIGVPDEITGEFVWIAFEGLCTEEGVQIEFDEATLEIAQAGIAMMAVVSK